MVAAGVWIQRNLVYIMIGLLGFWMVFGYYRRVKVEKDGLRRLMVFMDYLDSVAYQYIICQSIEEAVLEALDNSGEGIREVIEHIYHILVEEDEEKLRVCKEKYENSFFFQFLIYSYLAIEYGDNPEQSMYLSNLAFLKKQIFAWKLDRENLMHFFQGLVLLTIIPVQCLKLIEVWAQYNLADLSRYYDYGYGIIARFLLLFLTILCYQIVLGLRSSYNLQFHNKKVIRCLAEKQMLENCYLRWASYHPKKVRKLSLLLRQSSARITMQEFWVMRNFLGGVSLVCSMAMLAPMICLSSYYVYVFSSLALLVTVLLYNLPVWYLAIRIRLMRLHKEDEVYFFYSITQMIAQTSGGDVPLVLEWLELSGTIFVPTIQHCMDEYMFDNESSLEDAMDAEPFTPFIKLMHALMVSELVGLKTAVFPLKVEKEQFIEKRKQDNQIMTENKGVLGRFVAFIPMVCVISIYLIVPFVLESLVQLKEYVKQIQVGL